ncbi:MAG: hypothetical protein QOK16_4168 [Solirubrobacteraceae bacterium]|nr:hypothetical protein [Solirubrobacteraceae bacterium]
MSSHSVIDSHTYCDNSESHHAVGSSLRQTNGLLPPRSGQREALRDLGRDDGHVLLGDRSVGVDALGE